MFGGIVNPWCIDAFNKTSVNPNMSLEMIVTAKITLPK
jgi:hypothetical protein